MITHYIIKVNRNFITFYNFILTAKSLLLTDYFHFGNTSLKIFKLISAYGSACDFDVICLFYTS